mmetsp:Transcript_29012/g.81686  ORF Transcript_29012/g.81686 Transcript_29012/m.81686 type:complete len:80 (-) Transcript_29012:390-629(-)
MLSNELSHTYPPSGFADPVYAEALVKFHDCDIVLEILVMNRTLSTLSNPQRSNHPGALADGYLGGKETKHDGIVVQGGL